MKTEGNSVPLPTPADEVTVDERQKVRALVKRAEAGDKEAMAAMLQVDREQPDAFRRDMAKVAEAELLDKIVGEDQKFTRKLYVREQERLREELAGPDPSPLEALLVQRIALTCLQVYHADCLETRAMSGNSGCKAAEYWRKRQDAAHQRFLSAVKALAQVRRLEVPMVQLNVGGQQINIAQAGEASRIPSSNGDNAKRRDAKSVTENPVD